VPYVLGLANKKGSGMLSDCANISVVLVLNAADVLPQMLRAHQPAIIHSPASPNTKTNGFYYLRFGEINSLNATQPST
jgi:hypothetical protein